MLTKNWENIDWFPFPSVWLDLPMRIGMDRRRNSFIQRCGGGIGHRRLTSSSTLPPAYCVSEKTTLLFPKCCAAAGLLWPFPGLNSWRFFYFYCCDYFLLLFLWTKMLFCIVKWTKSMSYTETMGRISLSFKYIHVFIRMLHISYYYNTCTSGHRMRQC